MEHQAELVIEKEVQELLTEEALTILRVESREIPNAVAALDIIKDAKDYERAATAGISANRVLKQLEEMRKAAVSPWNEKVNRINAQFKYFITFFSGYKDQISARMKFYNDEQKRIAAATQKKLEDDQAKKQEKENVKAEKKGIAPAILPPAPKIEAPAKTVHIAGVKGRVTNVTRAKYQIVNEDQVPREFLCLDEKKISRQVRNRDLTEKNAGPWIKIWEEEEPSFV